MMNIEFSDKEMAVLRKMYESLRGNGFDFGYADEVRPAGLDAKQAQGVLRGLHKKIEFYVDPEFNQLMVYKSGEHYVNVRGDSFEEWLAGVPRIAKQ